MAGCLLGSFVSPMLGWASGLWFGAGLGAALAAAVLGPVFSGHRARACGRLVGLAAVVLVMAGWATLRGHEPGADRIDGMVADGAVVTVVGVVRGAPELVARPVGAAAPGAWRDDQVRFEIGVRSVVVGTGGPGGGGIETSGNVGVTAPVDVRGSVRSGQIVTVSGVFRVPSGPRNPGEPDWRRLGNERGMGGWISVPSAELVGVLGPRQGGVGVFLSARTWVRERARRAIGGDDAGVLAALVLGERDASFDGIYRVFQRAGVAHVLAVSGFHLALLGGFVAVLVRATGERGRLEAMTVLLVVALMLFMVPARAPIVRAGVLVVALLAGDAAGRRNDRLAVLAWAGVGLLIWRPSDASGLGFLLSVGVTAALLGMGERDRGRRWSWFDRPAGPVGTDALGSSGWWRSGGRWFKGAMRVNVSCWAVATPSIVAATGVCSLIAPIATLVIVPLAAVVLVLGWAQAIFGVLWPGGAERTSGVVLWSARGVGRAAGIMDGLPFSSLSVAGVGWVWCGLTTLAVAAWLFVPDRRRIAGGLLALCVVYAGVASTLSGRVGGLRADMFDVGDGTAVLIRSGGESLLWDCGGLHRTVGDAVADAAVALGVARVRTAVVTHANLDHFNGLPEAAERLGIETVLVTPALHASRGGAWGEVRAVLEARGVSIRALSVGETITVGRASGLVLWAGADPGERWLGNVGSLVVRFTIETGAGPRSLLMCGDLQDAGVAGLLERGVDVRADVMEAPHHGSANAAAIELVDRARPALVLQSTGRARVGLEAWADARERSEWLSTAERGAVYAVIGRDGSIAGGGFVPGTGGGD